VAVLHKCLLNEHYARLRMTMVVIILFAYIKTAKVAMNEIVLRVMRRLVIRDTLICMSHQTPLMDADDIATFNPRRQ